MTSRMPRFERLVAVAFAATGLAVALLFIGTASSEREHEQSRTGSLERELAEKQDLLANHAAYLAQLGELKIMLAQLETRLPSRFDVPAIEAALRAHALRAHVDVASMVTEEERSFAGFYAQLPIKIVVRGGTAQVLEYIDALLRDAPLRMMRDFLVESEDDPVTVRATLLVLQFESRSDQ